MASNVFSAIKDTVKKTVGDLKEKKGVMKDLVKNASSSVKTIGQTMPKMPSVAMPKMPDLSSISMPKMPDMPLPSNVKSMFSKPAAMPTLGKRPSNPRRDSLRGAMRGVISRRRPAAPARPSTPTSNPTL